MSALRRFTTNGNTHINGRYCDANEAMELIEQQAAEIDALKAHVERLRHHIALIKHKVEIDARKEVLLSVIGTTPHQIPKR